MPRAVTAIRATATATIMTATATATATAIAARTIPAIGAQAALVSVHPNTHVERKLHGIPQAHKRM